MSQAKKRDKSRVSRIEPITVWDALNQPVAEISEEAAKGIFMAAAVILLAIWAAPYWGNANRDVDSSGYALRMTGGHALGMTGGEVAGAQTPTYSPPYQGGDEEGVPEWYYVAQAIPGDVTTAFAQAATQVLDISEPVSQVAEFYEPGTEAVWNAWLELMADPY